MSRLGPLPPEPGPQRSPTPLGVSFTKMRAHHTSSLTRSPRPRSQACRHGVRGLGPRGQGPGAVTYFCSLSAVSCVMCHHAHRQCCGRVGSPQHLPEAREGGGMPSRHRGPGLGTRGALPSGPTPLPLPQWPAHRPQLCPLSQGPRPCQDTPAPSPTVLLLWTRHRSCPVNKLRALCRDRGQLWPERPQGSAPSVDAHGPWLSCPLCQTCPSSGSPSLAPRHHECRAVALLGRTPGGQERGGCPPAGRPDARRPSPGSGDAEPLWAAVILPQGAASIAESMLAPSGQLGSKQRKRGDRP